jgi:ribokinase
LAPRLTVVGSVNLDLVARCERLPRPGETVTGAAFERVPGGKGANQAVAAARLGADVRFVGAVGSDAFAEEALARLHEAGVELDVRAVDGPTGVALILVDAGGENQIVVAPGANRALRPDDVDVDPDDAVLCQLEIPVATVQRAAERSGRFFLNAAPIRPLPPEIVGKAELVVVNHLEYLELSEQARAGRVALTMGAEGAMLLHEGQGVAEAKPPEVTAVDGTAAGDAFTACLVVSLLEGRSAGESLRRACAAGALAASRFGAQPSLPTAAEVDAILAA